VHDLRLGGQESRPGVSHGRGSRRGLSARTTAARGLGSSPFLVGRNVAFAASAKWRRRPERSWTRAGPDCRSPDRAGRCPPSVRPVRRVGPTPHVLDRQTPAPLLLVRWLSARAAERRRLEERLGAAGVARGASSGCQAGGPEKTAST